MEKKIDARGMQCPLPVIEAKKAMETMTEAGIITVTLDNEIAVQNVLKLAKQKGVLAETETISKEEYKVILQIKQKAQQESTPKEQKIVEQKIVEQKIVEQKIVEQKIVEQKIVEQKIVEQKIQEQNSSLLLQEDKIEKDDTKKKKTVVVISSNAMGSGEDKLGQTLMKGFLFALTKQDVFPDTILFYNSGASLVAEGSESIEDIKSLEDEGVEIMTCGACLDYYELTNKVQVGSITNMYIIAEIMLNAGLIIRP